MDIKDYNTFTTNFDELIAKDKNGNILDKNEILNPSVTYEEKLEVGDFVKLKNRDYTVEIKHLDFNIPGIGIVEYAGSKVEIPIERLVLFNQSDIEYKIEQKKKIR